MRAMFDGSTTCVRAMFECSECMLSMCMCVFVRVCLSVLANSGVMHSRAYNVFYLMPNASSSVISSFLTCARQAASSAGGEVRARGVTASRLLGPPKENRGKGIDTLETKCSIFGGL